LHAGTFVPAGQSERLSDMRSRTQSQQGSAPATDPTLSADSVDSTRPATAAPAGPGGRDHRRRWPVVLLVLALVVALGGGLYLAHNTRAWSDRATELDAVARALGTELAETRAELEETQGTLALVETQLDGAQDQIHELADTVAQTGDDREIQRQVAEYQGELFAAATGVTGTMGQCISSQSEYTLALEDELVRVQAILRADGEEPTEEPSPTATPESRPDLNAMRRGVVDVCEAAANAHESLQQRLGNG